MGKIYLHGKNASGIFASLLLLCFSFFSNSKMLSKRSIKLVCSALSVSFFFVVGGPFTPIFQFGKFFGKVRDFEENFDK